MILLAFILGLAAGFGLFLWLDDRTLWLFNHLLNNNTLHYFFLDLIHGAKNANPKKLQVRALYGLIYNQPHPNLVTQRIMKNHFKTPKANRRTPRRTAPPA
jgi:hypothetical protein